MTNEKKIVKHLKYIGPDSWRRHVYQDENGRIWKHLDCNSSKEVCQKRGDRLYSSVGNSFDGEPDSPMKSEIICVFENEK